MSGLIFPLVAIARELRLGAVHPAWRWGVAVLPLALLAASVLAHSPLGNMIYAWAVAETPGADIPGLVRGVPPPGM